MLVTFTIKRGITGLGFIVQAEPGSTPQSLFRCNCVKCIDEPRCLSLETSGISVYRLSGIDIGSTIFSSHEFSLMTDGWRAMDEDEMIVSVEEWLGTIRL